MKNMILLGYLAVLSVFDLREKKIPLILPCIGFLASLCSVVYAVCAEPSQWEWTILFTGLGMLPGAFLMAFARLTEKIGIGDGLILLNLGMLLGYRECLLLLCFGVFLAAIFSVVMLIVRKADRNTQIPFLPFLTAVYLVEMFM